MEFDFLLTVVISSIASASVLLIATMGLAVVFGLMGVINLAHGEFIMFGAYAALMSTKLGIPFPLAILVATAATAVFGALVEILIIRHLYGRLFDTLLATWGLSLVLYQTAVLLFGTVTPGIGMPLGSLHIGSYTIAAYLVLMIGVAILVVGCIYWLMTRTGYGIMARAAIQDSSTAAAMGIRTGRINMMTFALGSGLAGFAGAVLLPAIPATPNMGFAFVIKAFLAVVAAGPVTLSGTVLAGGGLGFLASITSSFWITVFGDILFFCTTIMILWAWPRGVSERWRIRI